MAAQLTKADSDYINQTGNVANLKVQNGTISMWVNLDSGLAGAGVYLINYAADALNFFIVGNSGGGHADETLTWRSGAVMRMLYKNGENNLYDNTDHHLVVVCDGTDNRIALDGVEVAVTFDVGDVGTNDALMDTAITAFRIGSDGSGNGFTGSMWDFRIYSRGLSNDEIKILYEERGSDNITNDLVIRLPMNEGPDSSVVTTNIDVGPNGYDGAINATPDYVAKSVKT